MFTRSVDVTIAEKMVKYRADNNLSMKKFAEMVGINVNSINAIEKGGSYRRTTERKILDVIEK